MQEAAISRATLYNWMTEFSEDAELQNVPVEKDYLNKWASSGVVSNEGIPTADTMPDRRYKMLLSAIGKVDEGGQLSRKLVTLLVRRFTLSIAQACDIVGIDEALYGYKPRKPEADDQDVYNAMVALLNAQPSLTFQDLCDALKTTHPNWPRKQVKRVYRERRLYNLRDRKKGEKADLAEYISTPLQTPTLSRRERTGSCWNAIYLPADENDGTSVLAITDDADNAPLNAISFSGEATTEQTLQFFDTAYQQNGAPRKLRMPTMPPFIDKEIQRWAWGNKVAIHLLNLQREENALEVAGQMQGLQDALQRMDRKTFIATLEAWLA